MTVGEFYAWNGNIGSDNCLYYETSEYLGADKWLCNLWGNNIGRSEKHQASGKDLYENFTKLTEKQIDDLFQSFKDRKISI